MVLLFIEGAAKAKKNNKMEARSILPHIMGIIQAHPETYELNKKICEGKINEYFSLIKDSKDEHLEECMIYSSEGDVVDTCRCHYYIHIYPKKLITEIITVLIGFDYTSELMEKIVTIFNNYIKHKSVQAMSFQ